ncbi:GNAT family N-acetyltransferase [bacterium]|nr:GNAT family N-acetyltransferase [bacterium]NUN47004.1 GNAT family N-acetyltransferase [bacterium]
MNIIRCEERHIDKLVPLFDAYQMFYHQSSDESAAKIFLSTRIRNGESVVFIALDAKENAVGFTQLYPLFSSVSMQPVWLLNDLYVSQTARRSGVGEALMEKARRFAVETGAKGIELETGVENVQAQALYEKLGYQRNTDTYRYFLPVTTALK